MRFELHVYLHDSHGDAFQRRIEEMFQLLLTQGARIMSAQDDIDAATAVLDAKVTGLETSNQAVIDELVVIKGLLDAATQQTPPDLTALNHIGDRLDALISKDDAATATYKPV